MVLDRNKKQIEWTEILVPHYMDEQRRLVAETTANPLNKRKIAF